MQPWSYFILRFAGVVEKTTKTQREVSNKEKEPLTESISAEKFSNYAERDSL